MVCSVDANPITADTVKWVREGFDFDAKARLSDVSNTNFFLTVINVTEEDAGEFTCEVNNGIGETISNTTFLLVRREYYKISKNQLKILTNSSCNISSIQFFFVLLNHIYRTFRSFGNVLTFELARSSRQVFGYDF